MDTKQLKRIPLFKDASDEELKAVAAFAEGKEVDKGTVLMKEDGFSNQLMAIEDGKAEVSRDGKKVATLKKGDVFGEAGMLEDTQRTATVTATSRMKLITLGHFEVARLRQQAPEVYKKIEELVDERK